MAFEINAGGGAVDSFDADSYFTDGGAYQTSDAVETRGVVTAGPMAIYQSERHGTSFSYNFPDLTPQSAYHVRLHFAELTWDRPGERVFNVLINGVTVLSNFDLVAEAGAPRTAIVRTFNVTTGALDGLTISFQAIRDRAE